MSVLSIVKMGASALKQKARPVTAWDDALRELVEDMEETMHAAHGIGLAANQVGLPHDLAIIDVLADAAKSDKSELFVLTNPVMVETHGEVRAEEGCLSIPGLVAEVVRPERVVVKYQDLHGEESFLEAEGLLARALCHELDHLSGKLFIQMIPGIRGEMVRRKARKMARTGEWEDVHP